MPARVLQFYNFAEYIQKKKHKKLLRISEEAIVLCSLKNAIISL